MRAVKNLLARGLIALGARLTDRGMVLAKDAVGFVTLGRWLRRRGLTRFRTVPTRDALFDIAIERAEGRRALYLEMGVYRGRSLRYWSQRLHDPRAHLHGFDSFEGLPERWNAQTGASGYSAGGQVPVFDDPRVELFVGWFEDTLATYQAPPHDQLVVHLDADLYSSTATGLAALEPLIVPGTLLCFDEFHDAEHELRAFDEFLDRTGTTVRAVATTRTRQQWMFEVVEVPAG